VFNLLHTLMVKSGTKNRPHILDPKFLMELYFSPIFGITGPHRFQQKFTKPNSYLVRNSGYNRCLDIFWLSEFPSPWITHTSAHTNSESSWFHRRVFSAPWLPKWSGFPREICSTKVTCPIPRTIKIYSLYLSINDLYWSLSIFF
jgi:hypothetical protein